MKRKIIAAILALLLFAPTIQSANADTSGLCFTATNDTLLDLGSMTAYVNGASYVPAKVFSTFGVYYSYFDSKSTAMLYSGTKQIYFELTTGNSYDSYQTNYSVSAVFKYGQVYVPVAWTCSYFGLSSSYISGSGYGDILRLKNGAEVLSDSQFLEAATSLMRSRYNEYFGNVDPVSPSPSQPSQSENPTPNASVSLCFVGLPSEKLLDSLDAYSFKASFFITADEAKASPDTIRRICGSGHSIGVFCNTSPESEFEETASLVFEIAQIRPILASSIAATEKNCMVYAENNGFAYFAPAIKMPETTQNASTVRTELESLKGYTSISIPVTDKTDSYLPYVLQFIKAKQIAVLPLRETMT